MTQLHEGELLISWGLKSRRAAVGIETERQRKTEVDRERKRNGERQKRENGGRETERSKKEVGREINHSRLYPNDPPALTIPCLLPASQLQAP